MDPIAVFVSLIPGKEGKFDISSKAQTKVGRSRSCDIPLLEADISTLHCELNVLLVELDGSKHRIINIVDRSRNGTFINGNRLVKKDYILKNGDRLVFGRSCSFLFKYLAEEEESDSQISSMSASNTERANDDQFKKPLLSSQDVIRRPLANRRPSFFDRYIAGKELGSGHYAIVKEAIDKDSGDVVAVKIFHAQHLSLIHI